jgi:hypothetical protein
MDQVHQPWSKRGTGPWWIEGGGGQETHRSVSPLALWGPKARRGRCKRESSLRGSLPVARTGGGGWSQADNKEEQSAVVGMAPFIGQNGEPTRWEASGHRRRWDFNGVVGFME